MSYSVGVYRIRNSENGREYIGSSKNLRDRLTEHKRRLRKGIHCNFQMLCDWSYYGEEAFEFEVLLYCSEENRTYFEQYVMVQLRAHRTGYNNSSDVTKPFLGCSHTEATRIDLSRQLRKLSDEEAKEIKRKALYTEKSCREIAKEHGIGKTTVNDLKNGRIYPDIEVDG